MVDIVLASASAMFLWWFSTGVLIYIDGLPPRTFRVSLALTTVAGLAAVYGLAVSSADDTVFGAYVAFCSAVVVWGWHELTFLMGLITGPRKTACPPGARGFERFRCATETVIHHEVALAATLAAVVALTWNGPNQVGTMTLWVLWTMRISAKFNIFWGVRNLAVEIIPPHLAYLKSYFRKADLNPLMPISVGVGSGVVGFLTGRAMSAPTGGFEAIGLSLVATMLALAVLEHLFLALPVPDMVLWKWALRSHESGEHPA